MKTNENPPSKVVIKDGVEYKFVKNKKSKTVRVSIKSADSVYVSLPYFCPYKIAEGFVAQKREWIKRKLEEKSFDLIDENFKTKTGNLIITSGLVEAPEMNKAGDKIIFIYPIGADFYSKEIQKGVKSALKKALRMEAAEFLPRRLKELAEKFGFSYNKVALKTHKTRWGSCSFNDNINLNINLIALEEEFIDYVLIHELCHTVEKNHGARFWGLVEKCMPGAKKIRKELKKKPLIV